MLKTNCYTQSAVPTALSQGHTRYDQKCLHQIQLRQGGYGAGSGSALAELKACTPASPSPSKGVMGLLGPRQKSSSTGSANHTPTRLRSTRTRLPFTSVEENASWTIKVKVLWALPLTSVVKSPMYSAAPKGAPASSSRKT